MTDEGKLRDQAAKGAKARQIWESETLQSAFREVEANLIHTWRNTTYGDTDAREVSWRQLAALEEVKASIKRTIANGDSARTMLERMADAAKKILRVA